MHSCIIIMCSLVNYLVIIVHNMPEAMIFKGKLFHASDFFYLGGLRSSLPYPGKLDSVCFLIQYPLFTHTHHVRDLQQCTVW